MVAWPRYPSIYEINTWVWLDELSRAAGRSLTLASVPAASWDTLATLGFDAIWLMGLWERSPAGTAIADRNAGLSAEFQRVLPDYHTGDNVGSPYCVRRYVVDRHFGGVAGLASAREALARRGVRLVLDFVPNHVAPDHPWASERPEYFIRGTEADLARDPASFTSSGGRVFACGRDPYFPAWPDVLQLNAFAPELRAAAIATLNEIACQCDAVRCDMAMLMLTDVFERTWGERAGVRPPCEYWQALIPDVKRFHPDFRFMAEAYWDLESTLQGLDFAACYDKRLYDRLVHDTAESVRLHLCAGLDYQGRLVRFLENHDEPRAAATFPPDKARVAAVTMLTLPGAKLLYDGQMEGRTVRLPVFLARRPAEAPDESLREFYTGLLHATSKDVFRNGEWRLCERSGWPDNASYLDVVAWCWRQGEERYLVAVNLSGARSQARVRVPWAEVAGGIWRLEETLGDGNFMRSGDEMFSAGLYVDLPPWGWHFLRFKPESNQPGERQC